MTYQVETTDTVEEPNRAERRRRAKRGKDVMKMVGKPALEAPKEDPEVTPKSSPDLEPTPFEREVFNIASLVPALRKTYGLTEGASVKVVDLAVSLQLASMQLRNQFGPPPGARAIPNPEDQDDGVETEKTAGSTTGVTRD